MKYFSYLVIALLALMSATGCSSVRSEREAPYVVMVSLDAFRWDYDSIYGTPVLDDIADKGVMAVRLIPSFPTKTFPNHYSIATGLYPDHHGIVNNSFYAPDLDLVYRIGDRAMVSNGAFYSGEPIWITTRKAGLKTASFYWVGSEAPVMGIQPDFWKPFDEEVTFSDRVDTVLAWLSLPERKRPHLVTLYFEEPDAVSHVYGPLSPETAMVVKSLDSLIGTLRTGISKLPHAKKVNLIVLSDHGIAEIDTSRYNYIYDTLPQEMVKRIYGGSPVWAVEPVEGMTDSVMYYLNIQHGMKAYRREDLPAHLHYGTHPRIPAVVLIADPGWVAGVRPKPSGYNRGDHGYDWKFRDMHSIFYAEGPAFRKGLAVDTLYNVDVYNIISEILNLTPAPNDGNRERISPLLR
ncbi:MAG TPA: ectonucleotide pyrophosphatase/phosphodiesterase [Bacteroidales bacterium]|nr:ectonucleotide pyrophosphatase/phosphodiesterase [Bacteroidales bacterium]